jgi:hypothetical protein
LYRCLYEPIPIIRIFGFVIENCFHTRMSLLPGF